MAEHEISIKDIEILHARETVPGVLKVGFYSKAESKLAKLILDGSKVGEMHSSQKGSVIC